MRTLLADGSLRKGTLKCPMDGTLLHFENLAGCRTYRVVGGGKHGLGGMCYFDARCPKCKWHGSVRRGRYTKDDI